MLNSALKWVGGKRRIMDTLRQHLPTAPGRRLVEPFVGSATVFLNTDFDSYLLADINGDLINFHNPDSRDKGFTFEVDILNNTTCDISINLKLTERVIVKEAGGQMVVEAIPEPEPPYADQWAPNE
ncbi:hypothetical protein FCL49_05140 [Serratia proteamaculans]|uniref:DNA adenine methylase n=1 Tax=Serratia TaxID=613 RepID=UPI001575A09D|nr:hypothetical protein [Serratia proteamaculans]NTZ27485.1 hypothetical protein [Serratia proteamaculans]CAI0905957.1 DNA adenine methylase [Serratia quinivorans]